MRKLLVILLLVIIVGGGYSAYWFKKSEDFKHMLEQSIANINEKAKSATNNSDLIRYESIHASGYPFSMTLEIIKPVMNVPVTTIIQQMMTPPNPALASAMPAKPVNWIEEVSYGESVSFSGNLTGDHFTLVATGDRTNKTIVDGVVRHTFIGSSTTPFICHFTVEKAGKAPWTMRPFFTDLPTFLDTFRSFDCDVQGAAIKDATSDTSILTSESLHVATSNEAADTGNHKVALSIDSKNVKFTTEADALNNEYMQMTHSILGQPNQPAMLPMSEYGDQNIKIAVRYEGPVDANNIMSPTTHLHFDVDTFEMKNALFNTTLQLHVATAPEGDNRTGSITFHTDSDVTERYDQLFAAQFADIFNNIIQNEKSGPNAAMAQTFAQVGTPHEIATAVVPKFHSFGRNTFDLDAAAQGPNNLNGFIAHGKHTLNAFNWIAEPYGFKLSGNSNFSVPGKLPYGEAIFTCITCDALVNDLGDYSMRVEKLLNKTQPGKQPFITKDLVEGVKAFLHGVAENSADKNAKDLVIHLITKDTGEFTVSGKQIPELMMVYATTIAPHLPSAQPAAAPQPVTPSGK